MILLLKGSVLHFDNIYLLYCVLGYDWLKFGPVLVEIVCKNCQYIIYGSLYFTAVLHWYSIHVHDVLSTICLLYKIQANYKVHLEILSNWRKKNMYEG